MAVIAERRLTSFMEADVPKDSLSVAAVQMGPSETGQLETRDRIVRLIKEAARGGAELICFPELALTPYFPARPPTDQADCGACDLADPVLIPVRRAIRTAGAWVVLPLAERKRRKIYNSAVLFDPTGEVRQVYRKTHLPPGFEADDGVWSTHERLYFSAGDKIGLVADVGGFKCGMLICYDRFFPEAARIAALSGADFICLPSNNRAYGASWARHGWELLIRARAYENGVYVVAPDKAGVEFGQSFLGDSVIAGPVGGRVLARARTEGDEVILGRMTRADLESARHRSNSIRDRRPALYKELTS